MEKTQALLNTSLNAISIIGSQGSGKTTIGRKLGVKLKTKPIEISDVVKAANESIPDLQLAKTGERTKKDPEWLGRLVLEVIKHVKHTSLGQTVVLTGVREREVHRFLQREGYHIWAVDLLCDPHTRAKRLLNQGRVNTIEEFLDREIAELELGLRKLKAETVWGAETAETTKPQVVADAILQTLRIKGLK